MESVAFHYVLSSELLHGISVDTNDWDIDLLMRW